MTTPARKAAMHSDVVVGFPSASHWGVRSRALPLARICRLPAISASRVPQWMTITSTPVRPLCKTMLPQ